MSHLRSHKRLYSSCEDGKILKTRAVDPPLCLVARFVVENVAQDPKFSLDRVRQVSELDRRLHGVNVLCVRIVPHIELAIHSRRKLSHLARSTFERLGHEVDRLDEQHGGLH